jgi:peptidoglycan-associated lipoprotein
MRSMILAALAVTFACAHAQPPQEAAAAAPAPAPAPQKVAEPAKAVAPAPEPAPAAAAVYFELDSSTLSGPARATLQEFAQQLEKHPALQARIEGNCDERGSREYNLALGQRRAEAARRYLEDLGIAPARLQAISNGKEKPRNSGHDEQAWQENRRDDVLPVADTNNRL